MFVQNFIFRYLFFAIFGLLVLDFEFLTSFIALFCHALASISTFIASFWTNAIHLEGDDILRYNSDFAIQVSLGCSGLQTCWLLIIAIALFPASWQWRIIGIVIGLLILQGFNIFRLIILVYIGQFFPSEFVSIHEYIFPLFFHILNIIIFALWLIQSRCSQSYA